MENVKSMFCPNCGAPVQFQSGKEHSFCSSCGSQLYFKDDHLEIKLKYEDKEKQREYKLKKAKEDRKTELFEEFGFILEMAGIILLLPLVFFLMSLIK